jgi:putative methyltransferase (TIGR04325 family)
LLAQPNTSESISGVLAYLPDPWKTLMDLVAPYVFIDRTGLIDSDRDRLTIQHVPEWVYQTDMLTWFVSETKLLSALADAGYVCLCDFPAIDNYTLPGTKIFFKGFICRKNSHEH